MSLETIEHDQCIALNAVIDDLFYPRPVMPAGVERLIDALDDTVCLTPAQIEAIGAEMDLERPDRFEME